VILIGPGDTADGDGRTSLKGEHHLIVGLDSVAERPKLAHPVANGVLVQMGERFVAEFLYLISCRDLSEVCKLIPTDYDDSLF
jgi:hypothetical protein